MNCVTKTVIVGIFRENWLIIAPLQNLYICPKPALYKKRATDSENTRGGIEIPGLSVLAVSASLATPAWAEGLDTSLNLKPELFDVTMKPAKDQGEGLQEASFGSGLGFALSNSVLQLDMDYRVQSKLKESSSEADVSQRVGASLQSKLLNQILGLDADIRAGSTLRDGGYVYSLAPGFSKSLSDLGRLNVRYEYKLDKPGADAEEKEKTGYSMGLKGATDNGRVDWSGSYKATDVFGGVEQLQSTERMAFSSGLQVAPDLRLEVSGHNLDETRYAGGLVNELYTETLLGAGCPGHLPPSIRWPSRSIPWMNPAAGPRRSTAAAPCPGSPSAIWPSP